MKFRLVADIKFEAEDEYNASCRLADHFIFLQDGVESGCPELKYEGKLEIGEEVEYSKSNKTHE